MPKFNRDSLHRYQIVLAFLLLAGGTFLYTRHASTNPPGFFIDESSIAYNAHLIAQTGHDEHGESWPLFFRAFGEFKNPIYIYLLAALYRLTGPSILAARCLSATLGLATAFLLGLLAARVSGRRIVGLLVAVTALLTPWLFELSRLVMEVTVYPLALALFLLCVRHASRKLVWGWTQVCALALTLALLTYGYSIGRLLAPLLALGLILFVTRTRIRGLVLTWIAYAVTLIPLLVFHRRHPGALTTRFQFVTYIAPQSSWLQVARDFVKHYFGNLNPWRLFIAESSKVSEIVHIPGPPAMLTITAVLILASAFLLVRRREVDAWWRFIFYGLAVSVVPASLTNEYFHMLRLAALPIFLIVLTIPAFKWLVEQRTRAARAALSVTILLIIAQGFFFQWRYHLTAHSPQRLHTFDADYPAKILPVALANARSNPVYLADDAARPGYIQAFWYATLQRIPLEKFVLPPVDNSAPEAAVVITTESTCPRCRVLAESEPYKTYIAEGSPRIQTRLPDDSFVAEISVANPPARLRMGQQTTIEVSVKNPSKAVWLVPERNRAPFQVHVGNHWLDTNGKMIINDDGRAYLPRDLPPAESADVPLIINAPSRAGEYLLEIDMLQEGVSWFGLKGSQTWRGRVTVN
jgi:4-amino-4-deoxy-L-arabinose transferase-like glycosyltransferase